MVRTRFAPSPTGFLHIGGLRTAAYAFALAKHNKGEFLLRIEDTDQSRQVEGATQSIYKTLKLFGLNWDGTPIVQSERKVSGVYAQAAEKLLSEGHAFYCQCSPKANKDGGYSKEHRDPCRDLKLTSGAVKLKIPDNVTISFHDFVINKRVKWNSNEISDTVLLKSDGFPTYHLAVAVDDTQMGITHVIRAVEWLPSTPIHILVYRFLGYPMPQIGHPTDILDPTGGKLSKRKRNVSCEQFIAQGYLPEALLNFVILMGWAPKDNRELFSLDEFVNAFDPSGFQTSNPVYSDAKLNWFNGYYIRKLSVEDLASKLCTFSPEFSGADKEKQIKITKLIQERITKLSDIGPLADFFFQAPEVDKNILGKNAKIHLEKALDGISQNRDLMQVVGENNFKTGDFFMDLRIAITGSKFTPPINESIEILGKDEAIARIKKLL